MAVYKNIAARAAKLKIQNGKTVSEIAGILNTSERTVRRALQHHRESGQAIAVKTPEKQKHRKSAKKSPAKKDPVVVDESSKFNFILTGSFLSISKITGSEKETENLENTDPRFDKIVTDLLKSQGKPTQDQLKAAFEMISEKEQFIKLTRGRVEVDTKAGVVRYSGRVISADLGDRLIEAARADDDSGLNRLVKFTDRLYQNPSKDSVQQLFGFLQHNDIEIDDDGMVVAFKKIRENWKDCHSNTVDNSIGQEPYMPRWEVNADKHQTCSRGYHVCAKSYLSQFNGSRVVKVLVDPADFVSIPVDYNNAKARVCKYKVIEEVTGKV